MMRFIHETHGQATVELAVMIPVVIVSTLIVVNLGTFLYECSLFDRCALDICLSSGVAPPSAQTPNNACNNVRAKIEEAVKSDNVEIEVDCKKFDISEKGALPAFSPSRVKFICKMKYIPIPNLATFAGVKISPPLFLEHKKEIVCDAGNIGFGGDGGQY